MKVEFADSFFESLKKLRNHGTWWYKTYELFRYNLPNFFRNFWHFRKEIWRFRPWDSHYNLSLLRASLEKTGECIRHGNEVETSRFKKVAKIKRAVEILKSFESDNFIERAEAELGEIRHGEWDGEDLAKFLNDKTPEDAAHNSKVFARAREIEKAEWAELWRTIEGQPESDFVGCVNSFEAKDGEEDTFEKKFDGSGMLGWWD